MIYCIYCKSAMLAIAQWPNWILQRHFKKLPADSFIQNENWIAFLCPYCGIVYDIRQIGPSNRELERDQNLYEM